MKANSAEEVQSEIEAPTLLVQRRKGQTPGLTPPRTMVGRSSLAMNLGNRKWSHR
jgi:hypothetical protein